MISAINNHKASNPAFGCAKRAAKVVEVVEGLEPQFKAKMSNAVKKIFNNLSEVVDNKWVKYRKSKQFVPGSYPEFLPVKTSKDKTVSLRLMKNTMERYVLDVEKGGNIERVSINRKNPEQFVYERIVKTENGSYGTKTFDSTTQKDDELTVKVYNMYEEYLPLFSGSKKKEQKISDLTQSYISYADLK